MAAVIFPQQPCQDAQGAPYALERLVLPVLQLFLEQICDCAFIVDFFIQKKVGQAETVRIIGIVRPPLAVLEFLVADQACVPGFQGFVYFALLSYFFF